MSSSDDSDELDALFEEAANNRLQLPADKVAKLDSDVSSLASDTVFSEAESSVLATGSSDAISRNIFHSDEDQSAKPIFDRLGSLARMMHESMRELGYDRSLSDVVSLVADAQGRLEYVATLTEQAATKVLNATELGIPEQEALTKKAKDMNLRWRGLFDGTLNIEEFKQLAHDSHEFSQSVMTAAEAEKARLLDIMMAQDFQDLTGQLIKKVLVITQSVEYELAQILIDNAPPDLKEKATVLMDGPSVPNTALGQGDVDSLLDSLGF